MDKDGLIAALGEKPANVSQGRVAAPGRLLAERGCHEAQQRAQPLQRLAASVHTARLNLFGIQLGKRELELLARDAAEPLRDRLIEFEPECHCRTA